ncbi:hypothetical protein D3C72_146000 [compost metagenome]
MLTAGPASAAPKAKVLRNYVYQDCLVTAVSDGDTIKARCGEPGSYEELKIRLSGIDTPERKQAYGNRARTAMSAYVFRKQVDLICNAQDQYRRHICKVMVAPNEANSDAKTLDAGLGMLTLGLAWWYKAYAREQSPQDRGQYEFAEFEAKAKRAGLWADPDAVPPWEWRRTEKERKNKNW